MAEDTEPLEPTGTLAEALSDAIYDGSDEARERLLRHGTVTPPQRDDDATTPTTVEQYNVVDALTLPSAKGEPKYVGEALRDDDAELTDTSVIRDEHTRGPWEKGGPSPNPGGRPRGKYSVTDALRAQLAEPHPDGGTYGEQLAARMIKDALGGEVKAQIAVVEHIEGKPAQAVSLSLDGSSPLHHQVNVRSSPRIAPPDDDA